MMADGVVVRQLADARVAQIAVVPGGVPLDHPAQLRRRPQRRLPVEQPLDGARAPLPRVVRVAREVGALAGLPVGPEELGPLAPQGHHLVGEFAHAVLRERVAVAVSEAVEVPGQDVWDAELGPADVGRVPALGHRLAARPRRGGGGRGQEGHGGRGETEDGRDNRQPAWQETPMTLRQCSESPMLAPFRVSRRAASSLRRISGRRVSPGMYAFGL